MKANDWLTHREARAAFGFTHTTLQKWAATGIPALRGKMLPVRAGERADKLGRVSEVTMVCSRTLKAAAAAMHSFAAVDRTRWRTTRELAEEFGINSCAAYLWWRDGCPALGGKKIQMRHGLSSHKNRRRLNLFDRNEVMKAVDATAKDQTQVANPQWASAEELKAEFGIHPVTLFKWARIGIPSLGVKLRTRRFPTPVRCRGQKKRLAQLHQFDRTMVQRAARPQRPQGAMTVIEAVKQLGLSRGRIRRAVAQKKLTAIRGPNDTYRTGRASLTYILPPQVNGHTMPTPRADKALTSAVKLPKDEDQLALWQLLNDKPDSRLSDREIARNFSKFGEQLLNALQQQRRRGNVSAWGAGQ